MSENQTVTAVSTEGYWGKGPTLEEALKNAKTSFSNPSEKISISAYNCAEGSVNWNGSGFEYPAEAICIKLGMIQPAGMIDDTDAVALALAVADKNGKEKLGRMLEDISLELD